ncbi:hypothetical protein BCR33DRAFT_767252 [Rhizoclosmatium globosum]|uniref:Uncharacterized protein n=1 Tax=Rhizoclosmatium globosum TaxID=329046 RepID=A0A1Y2C4A7_9FUNG|nr:hypothetical protein BCR33DRAFT_767252 [Rhizoclosmatium globosum]|eukprot:ORY41868.1 hypothetical protein BCR33DRAFT_767252 [Rhizoclosmatium globosum]
MVRKASGKAAKSKTVVIDRSSEKKKVELPTTTTAKKVVFGDDSDIEQELEQFVQSKAGSKEAKQPVVTEDEDDEDEDDDDAPEAISIVDLKKQAQEALKMAKEDIKSQKLEAKAIQEKRQAKGREVNLEKEQKLIAAKSAKQAIDLSIFQEADRIAKSKSKEAVEVSKKRNHIVLENDDFDVGVKRKVVKSRKVAGFTVVPLDSTLVKQKPVAPSVLSFQKGQLFGDRIKRRPGESFH